ncbi:MAG: methyltransferase domain-containing protein [Chitinivibrionales bacterium]|nr:methyltransferase domain-containing protein [Chitinivibrionales bacterium]MBD3358090.1 methyltransferase domain-containing protein [Chitinivibrionales bacterium]
MGAHQHVCSAEHAKWLNNWARKLLQNPERFVGRFIKEGDTVADFGCGPGFFTVPMAEMVGGSGKVLAFDIQQAMLEIVRRNAEKKGSADRIELRLCISNTLVGLDRDIDFALAFYMVHELVDRDAFFGELRNYLRTNGRMLVVEPPFHVTAESFEETVAVGEKAGLKVKERPKWFMNRAVLFSR